MKKNGIILQVILLTQLFNNQILEFKKKLESLENARGPIKVFHRWSSSLAQTGKKIDNLIKDY